MTVQVVTYTSQRLPLPQNRVISDTFFSQLFLFIDNSRKTKSRKTRFVGRPPLSRLRRRFGPLRGTQRRCAALRAALPGRYAPRALRAQPFLEHEKKADFLNVNGSRGYYSPLNPARPPLLSTTPYSNACLKYTHSPKVPPDGGLT